AAVLPQREQHGEHGGGDEAAGDRPRDEQPGIGVAGDRADHVGLDLVAEHDAQNERRQRYPRLHHGIADRAEDQQHVDVVHAVAERIGADHAQYQHDRNHDRFRHGDDVQPGARADPDDQDHERERDQIGG